MAYQTSTGDFERMKVGGDGIEARPTPDLLRELFGEHPPGGWSYERHFNSPDLNQKPGFLARSGEHAGCASELGVHDMVGNLHEWVGDMVDHGLVMRMSTEGVERRDQPWHEGNGVFMGGFFSTTSELGPGCYFTTIAHEPTYHDYSTGFRCCDSVAPPGMRNAATRPSALLAASVNAANSQPFTSSATSTSSSAMRRSVGTRPYLRAFQRLSSSPSSSWMARCRVSKRGSIWSSSRHENAIRRSDPPAAITPIP